MSAPAFLPFIISLSTLATIITTSILSTHTSPVGYEVPGHRDCVGKQFEFYIVNEVKFRFVHVIYD
jgi:hypothetical protein